MTSPNIDNLDLQHLLTAAMDAARQAGTLVRDAIGGDLEIAFKEQGKHNLVTLMDTESERLIQRVLRDYHPEAMFLAEEGGGNQDLEQLTWVVDPIDGTVNYAHGIPIYAVSIGAVIGNRPVVGVVFDPSNDQMFTATLGGGAHVNGTPLQVSGTDTLERAFLVTGFPYNVEENPYNCIGAFVEFVKMGLPVRRLGSAALDLAYLAAGRFDAYWEVSLGPWDVAAGTLLVTEAGGIVGTYAPEDRRSVINTDRILVTNANLYDVMRERLLSAAARVK